MKTGSILVLAGAGLAAYLLLSPKTQSEGGTGGSLDIPAMFGTGSSGGDPISSGPVSSQPVAFQISDKILAAMRGDVQPATQSYGGSSPQAASELSLIQKKGFSTVGVSGSYDPSTGTVYTFAPQTVSKPIVNLTPWDVGNPFPVSKKSSSSPVSAPVSITGDFSSQGGGNYSGISPNATGHVSGRNIEHWEGLSSEAIYGFRPFSGDTSEVGGAKKQLQAHYGNTIDIQQTGTFFKAIPKKAVS